MLFTDPIFALFFFAVFTLRWLLPSYRLQKYFLLVCNALFYGAWDYRFLLLIFLYFVALHFIEQAASRQDNSRRWLIVSLAGNLGMLGFFKYFNFFVDSRPALLARPSARRTPLHARHRAAGRHLFYTFQTLSYVDRRLPRAAPAAARACSTSRCSSRFFPQLVAGPIVRARDFLPQLAARGRARGRGRCAAPALFLLGLLQEGRRRRQPRARRRPRVREPRAVRRRSTCCSPSCAFALQIYCDFSGYSDIAHRRRAAARLRSDRELRPPVPSPQHPASSGGAGTSASRPGCATISTSRSAATAAAASRTLPQPDADHGPGRPVARRRLELRALGRLHGASLLSASGCGAAAATARTDPPFNFPLFTWALTLVWVCRAVSPLFRCDSVNTFSASCSTRIWALGRGAPSSTPSCGGLFALLSAAHVFALFPYRRTARPAPVHQLPAAGYAFRWRGHEPGAVLHAGLDRALHLLSVRTDLDR